MVDLEQILLSYREAVRSLWNHFFAGTPELNTFDSVDMLDKIKVLLFQQLVCSRISALDGFVPDFKEPVALLELKPLQSGSSILLVSNPRISDRNRYFDLEVQIKFPNEARLQYIDFFEYNVLGYIDLRFYLVRIAALKDDPSLVGRDALLELYSGTPTIAVPSMESSKPR